MLEINYIDENSIAEELGIEAGDTLVSIDGVEVVDVLDYFFAESKEFFTMIVRSKGVDYELEVEKDEEENIGLNFTSQLETRTCHNKCVFCFVDQMPKGHRETLYCKDDDYRLSFISGNYITLTNDKDIDIERILALKLSPLYISVHVTDGELRKQMLNNRFADKIMEQLKLLTSHGIEIHTQIVLCEGINDGEYLQRSMEDLYSMYPMIKSLAIVPVGLTKFREGLHNIKPCNKNFADVTIDMVEKFSNMVYNEHGEHFVYCSDEFYCMSGRDIPNAEFYDNYPQIENGIGLVRKFEDEFDEAISESTEPKKFSDEKTLIVTGVSFYPHLKRMLDKINAPTQVIGVVNSYFGETVTVSGLLTGRVVIDRVKNEQFDRLLIPQNMLREFGNVFLDDISVEQMEKELNCVVEISPNNGAMLYNIL